MLKLGNYVIERLGDSCLPYEKDYFVIGNNNTYALGDMKTGKILTGQVYNDISILCRGVWIFQVRIGDKLGCINEKGEMVIPIKYDKIEAKTDYWSPWEEKFFVSLYEGNIVSNMDLKKVFE